MLLFFVLCDIKLNMEREERRFGIETVISHHFIDLTFHLLVSKTT